MSTPKISVDPSLTVPELFRQRIAASPNKCAYEFFDIASKQWHQITWATMGRETARWQQALKKEKLKRGDRVAIMAKNSREWVLFDQAALGLGLVTVPLYTDDRPDNAAYILEQVGAKLLLVDGRRQWQRMQDVASQLKTLKRIVSIATVEEEQHPVDPRLISLSEWVFGLEGRLASAECAADELATIVFTSGTTGKPKGVMLSHRNMLSNAFASSQAGEFTGGDSFLSFLPLSHMLERTAGYYMPMLLGAEVAFSRSIAQLADDLKTRKPTLLISVPRIYEKVYAKITHQIRQQPAWRQWLFNTAVDIGWQRFQHSQGRGPSSFKLIFWPLLDRLVARKISAALGGKMRYAVCGGAAIPPDIAKLFLALNVNLLQGFGMTEASPVVSVNRPNSNIPESIGKPLEGMEVKIGARDEMLVRGPSVMLGYWKNKKATQEAIDDQGWLASGDQARIDEYGHYHIIGRLKEIIVLGNGEKVPPAEMEMAITLDPLIEQVMIIGEGRSFLAALLVLNPEEWRQFAKDAGIDPDDEAALDDRFIEKQVLKRVAQQIKSFPGYAQVRRAKILLEPWTVDDGLLTATLKMKRPQISAQFQQDIESLFTLKR